jgi:DNA-3-methyladenine glycosylase I
MQAGLSWITILKKRAAFRTAFDNFDFNKVAKYKQGKIEKLMADPGIVRNRLKLNAAVKNAQAFIEVRKEFGTFNNYLWGFVDHKPIQNARKGMKDIPAKTGLAETLSKDLKKRGFTFVGPTIVYATMQATGMVNDHFIDCFRYREVRQLGGK